MPRYDYLCSECGAAFEMNKSIDERHCARCPKCDGFAVKVWAGTAPGIAFKGKGWTKKGVEKVTE